MADKTSSAAETTAAFEAGKQEPTLCFECQKKSTPNGIEWQDLCAACYDIFVEKPKA